MTYQGPSQQRKEMLKKFPEYQHFQDTIDAAFEEVDVLEELITHIKNGPYNPFERGSIIGLFLTPLSGEKIYKN